LIPRIGLVRVGVGGSRSIPWIGLVRVGVGGGGTIS